MPRAVGKRPSPVSIRLTDAERAQLLDQAGTAGLSTYIKLKLFRNDGAGFRRLPRRPDADAALLAQALAQMGRLQVACDLNALAKASQGGLIQLDTETDRQLRQACEHVRRIRELLVAALGSGRRTEFRPEVARAFAGAARQEGQ